MKIKLFSSKNLEFLRGSSIRILGYSKNKNVEVLSENKKYKKYKGSRKIRFLKRSRLLKIFIELYCLSKFFKPLKIIINRYEVVKTNINKKDVLIFHQDAKLGYYLNEEFKINCIYDIHGILLLQKEYLEGKNLIKKILFLKDLIIEKKIYRSKLFFNATSKEMKNYLIKKFNISPNRIFIAPDGSLLNEFGTSLKIGKKNIGKKNIGKKNILFIGSFKKFGGAFELVKAFERCNLKNVNLLLFGDGQDKEKIQQYIKRKNLKNIKLNGTIRYEKIPYLHSLADVIVCPDTENKYNSITPHIKVFDSLHSEKPLILAYFTCLSFIKNKFKGIEFYRPGKINELKEKIESVIKELDRYKKNAANNRAYLGDHYYSKISKEYYSKLINFFNKNHHQIH